MRSAHDFLRASMSLWTGLWILWLLGALAAKRSMRRQSVVSRITQALPVIAGFYLLFAGEAWPRPLRQTLVPATQPVLWTGLALTASGIAFAIWARLWIGRNWSGTVTIKERHELIQSGPYALVRHPIYSGFLLAFLGTAMIEGQVRSFLGFLLVLLGWGMKLRMEESFMTQQFGNVYREYKQRVKALVPFVV